MIFKTFNPEKWTQTFTIQNDNFLIRPALKEDKKFVWKAYKDVDPTFNKYIIDITQEMVDSWYNNINYENSIPLNCWLLEQETNQISRFVGNSTLGFSQHNRMSHVGGIGLGVLPKYQRRGIATKLMRMVIEVAQETGLRRLELTVVKENHAISLYQKLGFQLEGTLRNRFHLDGVDYDMYYMGLLLEKH